MFLKCFGIISHQLIYFCCSFALPTGKDNSSSFWAKINQIPVCFSARGQKPGTFHYTGDGRLVGAMKLVYIEGSVGCEPNPVYRSRWGCYHHPGNLKHSLNVVITDSDNNVVYPPEKYFKNTGLWYFLPFTDARYSNQLVFTDYSNPFYLEKYSPIRIWYGEDLTKYKNRDNIGRVCVDVWAHLM